MSSQIAKHSTCHQVPLNLIKKAMGPKELGNIRMPAEFLKSRIKKFGNHPNFLICFLSTCKNRKQIYFLFQNLFRSGESTLFKRLVIANENLNFQLVPDEIIGKIENKKIHFDFVDSYIFNTKLIIELKKQVTEKYEVNFLEEILKNYSYQTLR